MTWVKRDVVTLSTNEKTDLQKFGQSLRLKNSHVFPHVKEELGYYQHLYILSNEKPSIGDWSINLNSPHPHKELCRIDNKKELDNYINNPKNKCRKIIATTDKSLIMKKDIVGGFKTGLALPQPSQFFIKVFVESHYGSEPITQVMVEYEVDGTTCGYEDTHGLGTCDGACQGFCDWRHLLKLKVNPKDNTISIRKVKNSWNREEVIELIEKFCFENCDTDYDNEKWIEDNL